jgi:hypothetical protein
VVNGAVNGLDYRFVGTGFEPGEMVQGTLYSTPVDLGTVTADANGMVVFSGTLATALEPGAHRIVMTGERSGTVEQAFTLAGPSAPSTSASSAPIKGGDLPGTGSGATSRLALAGVIALALGAAAVIIAIRRRTTE